MMDMYFNIDGGYAIFTAQVIIERISGEGGYSNPVLKVPLKMFYSQNTRDYNKVIPQQIQGILFLNGQKISFSQPFLVEYNMTKYPQDMHIELQFPINSNALEFVDKNRNGDVSLKINIKIQYLDFREDGSPPIIGVSTAETNFNIPQSDWVKGILPSLCNDRKILIELDVPEIDNKKQTVKAIEALKQAQDQFNNGLYDNAVGKCRIALEPYFDMKEVGGVKRKVLKDKWKSQIGDATYNWITETMRSTSEATNKSHHSTSPHYDRAEAQLIIIFTTGLIYFINRSDE